MRTGAVYTETIVHMGEPYQILIVSLDEGGRVTGRASGDTRLVIDDKVIETDSENGIPGIPYFRKL
ncbi:MAG: hypothetical protein ABJC09_05080 [Terriglobia bacterium]